MAFTDEMRDIENVGTLLHRNNGVIKDLLSFVVEITCALDSTALRRKKSRWKLRAVSKRNGF